MDWVHTGDDRCKNSLTKRWNVLKKISVYNNQLKVKSFVENVGFLNNSIEIKKKQTDESSQNGKQRDDKVLLDSL